MIINQSVKKVKYSKNTMNLINFDGLMNFENFTFSIKLYISVEFFIICNYSLHVRFI